MSMPSITTNLSSSLPMDQYQGQFDGTSSIDFFNNALDLSLSPTSPSVANTGLTPPLPQPNVSPALTDANVADDSSENTEILMSTLRFAARTASHARTDSALSPSQLLDQIHGGQYSNEQHSSAPGFSIAPSALHGTPQEHDTYTTEDQVDLQTFLNGLVFPTSSMPPQTDGSYAYAAQGYPLYTAGSVNVLTTEGVAPNGMTWGVQTTSYTVPSALGVPHLSPIISPAAFQSRQISANLASPSMHSPQLSNPSPRISRHARMLSTTSSGLSAPSPSVMLRTVSASGTTSDLEDHEESGSSAYSPWSVHGRHLSSCYSEGLSPSIALQHLASTSVSTATTATTSAARPRVDKADAITVEQWMDTSLGPMSAATYAISPATTSRQSVEPPKKRKRLSRAAPSQLVEEFALRAAEEEEDMSSEDEFTFAGEESTDSDADFEEKARKRSAKKRRVSISASSPASSLSHSHGTGKGNALGMVAPNYGQEVKVHTLIPIDRKDKSCPHCGFVPSNGRFSDLKRHHQKHLIDGCAGKEMWVCTLCGDIAEQEVNVTTPDGSETGQVRRWKVYYPNISMVGKIVKYTRKDSAKRHWQKEHGDKGVTFQPSHLAIVDDVKEESQ